jgi:hypothetical protein
MGNERALSSTEARLVTVLSMVEGLWLGARFVAQKCSQFVSSPMKRRSLLNDNPFGYTNTLLRRITLPVFQYVTRLAVQVFADCIQS